MQGCVYNGSGTGSPDTKAAFVVVFGLCRHSCPALPEAKDHYKGGLCFEMKEINLTRGLVALVDDNDYMAMACHKWCATPSGSGNVFHAYRNKHGRGVFMHREILQLNRGQITDHINRNGLDNRRANLRVCTRNENQANRGPNRNNKSGYKGVDFDKRKAYWRTQITAENRNRFVGYFDTAIEAAVAYNAAARLLHGVFAYQNIVPAVG